MPIYEYKCKKCGDVFEVLQKASDPPPSRHECGSRKVERLMSSTAFVFKGEGWYVTDYARKDKKAREGKSESSDSGSGKGDDSKPGKSKASKASAA